MIIRPSGITIDDADGVSIEASGTSDERGGPIRVVGPIPSSDDGDIESAVVAAMVEQGLTLLDDMTLASRGDHGRAAGAIRMEVPIGGGQAAVILAEQDGLYRWVLPHNEARSGAVRRTDDDLIAAFTIPADFTPADDEYRRGLWQIPGRSRIKTFVFRFAARTIVRRAVRGVDERVDVGLVWIRGTEPRDWGAAETLQIAPRDGGCRVLVLVHGTFSSTVGCFGSLGCTPWGRAFLEAALAHYDLVLGWDHKTLSEDPAANAGALANALSRIDWPTSPQIDVISHSRGGLVVRALLELALGNGEVPKIRRAVFVGAANAGTELARPANWHRFVDLYTSLAAASCRVLSLLPHAAPAAEIARGIVRTIGALVRAIVDEGLDPAIAPGLAAMIPEGTYLSGFRDNLGDVPVRCFLIAADFEPGVLDRDESQALPLRLALWAADNIIDSLMNGLPNDLVVNTDSMNALGANLEAGWSEALTLMKSPNVYHTNYFARPEVVNLLTRWLGLPAPEKVATGFEDEIDDQRLGDVDLNRRWRGSGVGIAADPAVPLPMYHRHDAPGHIDVDILLASEAMPTDDLLDAVETKAPSYVIVRRRFGSKTINYAYSPDELLRRIADVALPGRSTGESLDLHESDRSVEVTVEEAVGRGASSDPIVVVDGDVPIGVLPPRRDLLIDYDIPELVDRLVHDKTLSRRAMPSFGMAGAPLDPESQGTALEFGAQMPAETEPGKKAVLEVVISREALAASAPLMVSARASAPKVSADSELEVEVVARRGFAIDAEPSQTLAVPGPGVPAHLRFDLLAGREGPASVWIFVRQEGAQLARLVLEPRIVARASGVQRAEARATAEAGSASAPEMTLEINEVRQGDERRFLYRLRSDKFGVQLRRESTPLALDAEQYVNAIYQQIEESWTGSRGQVEVFERKLRSIGGRLWSELIPVDLQTLLWENRSRLASIQVVSEEPFIPWEMLAVVEPGGITRDDTRYFAEFGLVRWLWEAPKSPPVALSIGRGRSWSIIPDYPTVPAMRLRPLPEARAEAEFLAARMRAEPMVPLPADVAALLAGPDRIDFLHFAGHGFAGSGATGNPQIMLDLERLPDGGYVANYLLDTEVRLGTDFGATRPIIMLNACQAGRAQWSLSGIGGFAEAFLARGAGMFAGTLWSVADAPARIFSETLYSELLEGETLACATRAAREAARKSGDASWLAYAVYGHPDARLTLR